jgi:hypothetical protein
MVGVNDSFLSDHLIEDRAQTRLKSEKPHSRKMNVKERFPNATSRTCWVSFWYKLNFVFMANLHDALPCENSLCANLNHPLNCRKCASNRCRIVNLSGTMLANNSACASSNRRTSSALSAAPTPRQARMRPRHASRVKGIGSS